MAVREALFCMAEVRFCMEKLMAAGDSLPPAVGPGLFLLPQSVLFALICSPCSRLWCGHLSVPLAAAVAPGLLPLQQTVLWALVCSSRSRLCFGPRSPQLAAVVGPGLLLLRRLWCGPWSDPLAADCAKGSDLHPPAADCVVGPGLLNLQQYGALVCSH